MEQLNRKLFSPFLIAILIGCCEISSQATAMSHVTFSLAAATQAQSDSTEGLISEMSDGTATFSIHETTFDTATINTEYYHATSNYPTSSISKSTDLTSLETTSIGTFIERMTTSLTSSLFSTKHIPSYLKSSIQMSTSPISQFYSDNTTIPTLFSSSLLVQESLPGFTSTQTVSGSSLTTSTSRLTTTHNASISSSRMSNASSSSSASSYFPSATSKSINKLKNNSSSTVMDKALSSITRPAISLSMSNELQISSTFSSDQPNLSGSVSVEMKLSTSWEALAYSPSSWMMTRQSKQQSSSVIKTSIPPTLPENGNNDSPVLSELSIILVSVGSALGFVIFIIVCFVVHSARKANKKSKKQKNVEELEDTSKIDWELKWSTMQKENVFAKRSEKVNNVYGLSNDAFLLENEGDPKDGTPVLSTSSGSNAAQLQRCRTFSDPIAQEKDSSQAKYITTDQQPKLRTQSEGQNNDEIILCKTNNIQSQMDISNNLGSFNSSKPVDNQLNNKNIQEVETNNSDEYLPAPPPIDDVEAFEMTNAKEANGQVTFQIEDNDQSTSEFQC